MASGAHLYIRIERPDGDGLIVPCSHVAHSPRRDPKIGSLFRRSACVGRSSVTCCDCDCIGGRRSIKKAVAEQQARAVRGGDLKMVEEK